MSTVSALPARPESPAKSPVQPEPASSPIANDEAKEESEDGQVEDASEDATATSNKKDDDRLHATTYKEPPNDGWEPMWDGTKQAWYFYNRLTGLSQWENPRINASGVQHTRAGLDYDGNSDAPSQVNQLSSEGQPPLPPGTEPLPTPVKTPKRTGGYNPAIHGSYDPNADYARAYESPEEDYTIAQPPLPSTTTEYNQSGNFNRFTGRFQSGDVDPDQHNDAAKSKRQLNAFFDVDAAANSHDGRSLKAERQGLNLSKSEVKAFRNKRREKKEEKRRAWLRD